MPARRPHTSSGATSSFGRPQQPPPLYSSTSSSFLEHLPPRLTARRSSHQSHVRTGSVPSHDVNVVPSTSSGATLGTTQLTLADLVAQTAELQLVTPRAPAISAARCPPSSGRPVRRPGSRGRVGDMTPTTPSRTSTSDGSDDDGRFYGRKVLATTLASHAQALFPPMLPSGHPPSPSPLPPGIPPLAEFAAYLLHRTQPPRTFCCLALHILGCLARSRSPPDLWLPAIAIPHHLRPHAFLLAAHVLSTYELMDDAYSSKSFNIASGRILTATSSRWGHTPGERPQEDSRAVRKIDALVMECLRSLGWTVRAASEDARRAVRLWEAEIERREEQARWPVQQQPWPSPQSRPSTSPRPRTQSQPETEYPFYGGSGSVDVTPDLSPDMGMTSSEDDVPDSDRHPYARQTGNTARQATLELPVSLPPPPVSPKPPAPPAPEGPRKKSIRQSWNVAGFGKLRARVEGVLA